VHDYDKLNISNNCIQKGNNYKLKYENITLCSIQSLSHTLLLAYEMKCSRCRWYCNSLSHFAPNI